MNPKLFLAGVLEKWAVRLREKKEGAAVKRTGILKREIKVPPVFMAVVFVGTFFWILLLEMGLEKESLGRVALIVLLMAFFAIFAIRHFFHELIKDEEKITFLGLITTLTLLLAAFLKYRNFSDYIIPVPLATILIHVFLGPGLAFLSSIMLSLAFSFIHQFDFIIFLLSFFLSLVALFSTFRVFNRNDIVRAGVFITLSEIFFVLALSIFAGYRFMQTAGVLGVSLLTGFGSSVLAIGILPLVENFFDICSNIKLLEIADFNQPLLKKLITEAPGTYHHSLLVASMAESAASSIGVNPILVRVGAYYHDIGKLYKPDYFIENSINGFSRHEDLNPKISGLVITGHVKEGLHLAEESKLPTAIQAFIIQHHGTSLMHFFYIKALQTEEEELAPEEFRYPGPKPQSKEVALVMLADSVEAAVRTLEKPNYDRVKDLVQKVINNKFIDSQLDQCPLTLKDLHQIGNSFIHSIMTIYHNRIEYPEETPGK